MLPGTLAIWDRTNTWRKICIVVSYILTILLYFLNVYWYMLIVRNVCKMAKALKGVSQSKIAVTKESLLLNTDGSENHSSPKLIEN